MFPLVLSLGVHTVHVYMKRSVGFLSSMPLTLEEQLTSYFHLKVYTFSPYKHDSFVVTYPKRQKRKWSKLLWTGITIAFLFQQELPDKAVLLVIRGRCTCCREHLGISVAKTVNH